MANKVINKGDAIHIRLSSDLKQRVQEYCRQNDVTITNLVTSLLEKELKKRKSTK